MVIDVLFALLICWGFYRGFTKGFIVAVCSFIGYFIGVLGALKFTYSVATYLEQSMDMHSKYMPFIAFILIFIVLVIIVRFIGIMLTKVLKVIQLNFLNRIAGVVLLCIIYSFIFSTILWIFHQVNLIGPELKAESFIYPLLEPLAPAVVEKFSDIMPFFQDAFKSLEKLFDDLATKTSPLDVEF